MQKLTIEWLTDSYECDTCGYEYAEGFVAHVDGEFLCEFIPSAYCRGCTHIDRDAAYEMIINKLGYEVEYA